MSMILIALTSIDPGRDAEVHEALSVYGNDCRPLPNMWVIDTSESLDTVHEFVTKLLGKGDHCIVAPLEGDWRAHQALTADDCRGRTIRRGGSRLGQRFVPGRVAELG